VDDKRGQPGRILDLARYVPDFLREVKEFRQLYGAQEGELKQLYGDMDSLWKDSLIPDATIQGIKRYELMLGLKPYSGDTLEERRAAVSLKWNQQLPYTLPRLKERLAVIVENDGYILRVSDKTYELELWIVEQPWRVLQELRDMTRQMIPANLLFIFAGLYPIEIPVNTATSSRLELTSNFYARYNREFLYLDGTWKLDGTYLLNGYKKTAGLDLYPFGMLIRGNLSARNVVDGRAVGMISEVFEEIKVHTALLLRSSMLAGTRVGVQQWLRGHTALSVDTEMRTACQTDATVYQKMQEVLTLHSDEEVNASIVSVSGMLQQVSTGPEMMCRLTVENDLWYLDGTYLLDGTKLLDAEIFEYEL